MHRRHTISCLKCANYRLLALLEEEEAAGRKIHIPNQTYNPQAGVWNYHWRLRGHTRQLSNYRQVEIIMEFINSPNRKRLNVA